MLSRFTTLEIGVTMLHIVPQLSSTHSDALECFARKPADTCASFYPLFIVHVTVQ